VTVRTLAGVAAFDGVLVVVGICVLWGVGAVRTVGGALRLVGLAWLAGASAIGMALSLELMAGVTYSLATALVTAMLLAAAGVGLGIIRRRGQTLAVGRMRGLGLIAALGIGCAGVVLEAQFRAGRLGGVYEFDAMDFWLPKAKAIYYFGQLKPSFLAQLPNAFYPPLMPALDAMCFTFMGSADTVTLNLVYWSALAAFVAASAGLLMPRVPGPILWPTLLALLTVPVIVNRGVAPLADLPMDYLVAIAALLVAFWLSDPKPEFLVLASGLLGAAALTKREGLLLALCVAASGMSATWSRKRPAWPLLVAVVIPALALTVAWRVWLSAVGIPNQAPELGYLGLFTHLGRVWPSLHLTLHVLFGGSWWQLVPVLIVIGIGVAVTTRRGRLTTFAAAYFILGVLACSWVTLSFPSLPFSTDDSLNPIVRLTGGLVIPAATMLPLLLAATWDAARRSENSV
jgi:hypothetical protein